MATADLPPPNAQAGVRRTSMLLLAGNLEQALKERTMVHEAQQNKYGSAPPVIDHLS